MSTAAIRDRALIEEVLRGQSHAFGTLLAPYRRKLFLHILQIVKSPSDADDVMQDALIRAFRALGKFRGDATFSTWLYRIATNAALMFLARQKRLASHQSYALPELLAEEPEGSVCDNPEQVMVGKQMLERVDAALEAMHPEFKTAMLLREYEGLSYHEIAENMVCPVGTVRSRISSARNAIATTLRREGFIDLGP